MEFCKNLIRLTWPSQDFNHLGMAFFSLRDKSVEYCEFHEGVEKKIPSFYFDLASLTKPLTLGALALKRPILFQGPQKLLLEHRGGLPSWAILGKKAWRETLLKYPIEESETLYSDLSALRLMLFLEEETKSSLKELSSFFWDEELLYWKELPQKALCPDTGIREGKPINAVVNDDNCYKINRFCSHAGLFSTLSGLVQSLFNLEDSVELTKIMRKELSQSHSRFPLGWDTVDQGRDSLAGLGCPPLTFGHLGFTGTSFWIDAQTGRGWALLTNVTRKYWFHRNELNSLRKELGQWVWSH